MLTFREPLSLRPHTTADPIARLQHDDPRALPLQFDRRRQSCQPGTRDDDGAALQGPITRHGNFSLAP